MEPMTLGSPSGSPATNASPFLPSFLMGEPQAPTTPRSNTLSPNKVGRNLSFATSPGPTSPQDFNRSALGQKTLFGGGYQQTPPVGGNYPGTPMQSHNSSISGPPTQGLFDALRSERNQVQTPTRAINTPQTQFGTTLPQQHPITGQFSINQNFQQQSTQQQFNDSFITSNSFNTSRLTSPLGNMPSTPLDYRSGGGVSGATSINNSYMLQCPPTPRYTEFWVTVYGFPPSAAAMILQHFSQSGTIVDKVFPTQNGNWVHLKFSSRLECDKALNYNEKILASNIMIGVTQCKDKNIIDKENICENNTQTSKVRPLAQTSYKSAQNDSAVVASPSAPQKSSGLMNKAMDLFFGW